MVDAFSRRMSRIHGGFEIAATETMGNPAPSPRPSGGWRLIQPTTSGFDEPIASSEQPEGTNLVKETRRALTGASPVAPSPAISRVPIRSRAER
jgi:hypothetical protein